MCGRFFQAAFQRYNVFRQGIELLFCKHARLRHLVRPPIGSADCRANSVCHFRQSAFLCHFSSR
jgi:hypothetical protein